MYLFGEPGSFVNLSGWWSLGPDMYLFGGGGGSFVNLSGWWSLGPDIHFLWDFVIFFWSSGGGICFCAGFTFTGFL